MENTVLDMERFMINYPSNRVAFPECQYVPQLELHWDKIAKLNTILNDYNLRQSFNSYSLHETTMQFSKQKKSLVVRQSRYREFNDDLKKAGHSTNQDFSNLGYHIDEGAPKTMFVQHIRKLHKYGFNDGEISGESSNNSRYQHKISSTIFVARNLINKMKDPKTVDARISSTK